ncbi:MAG: glycosyltransferase family 4 protein [Silicimonas sp.]|nr:glycosyltransferase family 4 protein [Silicimonas sp.]
MHVAYLINLYPQVSHTFIRREILALEAQGVTVDRIAIRGWDDDIVDDDDHVERKRTRYVLKDGTGALLADTLQIAFRHPARFLTAFRAAVSMSRHAFRPLPYHLIWLAQACRIRRWTEATGASHLHAHFGTNPAEIARLVHLLGGPSYSFTVHGPIDLDGERQLHFPAKMGDASFIAAITAYCRSQIMRQISRKDWPKLNIVHCALDADYFCNDIPPFPDTLGFLSVARLSPEKGHFHLLDGFAAVHARHPEARLVLAGDGPSRSEIEARITEMGLTDAVEITGWVDAARVKAELARATAFVLPSFSEGLPVVIMEAMARGRPVISTYVAGIPELVLPGKTGWLVPPSDTEALTAAMLEVASADDSRLRAMAEAGRDRAKERHSIKVEAAKLKVLFQNAAS